MPSATNIHIRLCISTLATNTENKGNKIPIKTPQKRFDFTLETVGKYAQNKGNALSQL